MKLYIDTSQRDKLVIALGGERFAEVSQKDKSETLLSSIDKALRKKNIKLADLSGLEVNTGPGSFTGLRIGVSVAITLGWALGIPVNGKDIRKGEVLDIKYS